MINQQQSPVPVDCTRIRCKPPIFLRSREQCNNIHCGSRSLLSSRLSRYPYAAVDKWQLVVYICSIRVSLEVLLLDRVVLLRLASVTLVLAPRFAAAAVYPPTEYWQQRRQPTVSHNGLKRSLFPSSVYLLNYCAKVDSLPQQQVKMNAVFFK